MKLSSSGTLKIFLYKIRARLTGRRHPLLIEDLLQKNFKEGSPFSFIQVGAHNGVSYDSLYDFVKKRQTKGVVIEPLPDLHESLVMNYKNLPGVTTVQKAIHATEKEITLYRVDPAKLDQFPQWAGGIASIHRDHHQRSGIPAEAMITQKVSAGNLVDILEEIGWSQPVDLLQIDVEGFDYEVLKQVDFEKLNPTFVKMEYANLSTSAGQAARQLLEENSYWCFHQGLDLIGVRLNRIRL